jgi:hypothetical protein
VRLTGGVRPVGWGHRNTIARNALQAGAQTEPLSRQVATDWLRQAERFAGLQPLRGGVWPPFRRRWATERKHLPAKDVAAVGGWVDTTTLERRYQVADAEMMERVVMEPRRLRQHA